MVREPMLLRSNPKIAESGHPPDRVNLTGATPGGEGVDLADEQRPAFAPDRAAPDMVGSRTRITVDHRATV